jgi:hypothetical protein
VQRVGEAAREKNTLGPLVVGAYGGVQRVGEAEPVVQGGGQAVRLAQMIFGGGPAGGG